MLDRKRFMFGATALALAPRVLASGRPMKTPLMLDTKRMAIYDLGSLGIPEKRIVDLKYHDYALEVSCAWNEGYDAVRLTFII